jgi:hypothetical protein
MRKKMMNKFDLQQILVGTVATVVFTKTDGSTREMKCTLIPEYLPAGGSSGQQLLTEQSNSNTMTVWDLDNNAWRSFRVDTVNSISTLTNETHIR